MSYIIFTDQYGFIYRMGTSTGTTHRLENNRWVYVPESK